MATPNDSPTPEFQPYISDEAGKTMKEFTWSAVLLGTALGLVFAASSLYLVLKVGITVSASIPVAVLAVTFSRLFRSKTNQATILENNIVQTAGSAGESIAFGVGVTMPALLMLGFGMDWLRVLIVSLMGGILGILVMIPMRRAFIVKMHGKPGQPGTLLYPEGTACAQVLVVSEKGGSGGAVVFVGFFLAFFHKFLTLGLKLLQETVTIPIKAVNKACEFAGDMASELLGVGYIIGFKTSAIMMAGAVLGYLVIIPTIFYVGQNNPEPVQLAKGAKLIKDMSVSDLRNGFLLYIGAGCVATAGIISMVRTLPIIVKTLASGFGISGGSKNAVRRTEDDLPMTYVIGGALLLIVLLAVFLSVEVPMYVAILGALLVLVFGFLFVTVSARLTGEIGSSSNPISGMTTTTLMVTCLMFVSMGLTSPTDRVLALSIAAVVCIAASNGGTTAQSLKTGFLVGGTPRAMQYAILFGALISGLVIGGTLIAFNAANTIYSSDPTYFPKDAQKQVVVLSDKERARLPEKQSHEGKEYFVWDTRREVFLLKNQDRKEIVKAPDGLAPDGRYLIDPADGKVAFLIDPTIGGSIDKVTVDGKEKEVLRFSAPKTRVMTIIIDGVLSGKLNWSLVIIGAFIALTMELSLVSALAFAVGVYVPIANSVPIFIGGCVRLLIDRYHAKAHAADKAAAGNDPEAQAQAEVEAIRRSETSPGVLLASGIIAGGSIAGVLASFLAFNKGLEDTFDLSSWTAKLGEPVNMAIALVCFGGLTFTLWAVARGYWMKQKDA
ncbi:MAG TPA: oligopeptide transporter, OPT family [Gemmatales bacterium]|nr:oligopeptide transporter, OPT family [Gemmatales bacterium]